jgi:hypothetical protein
MTEARTEICRGPGGRLPGRHGLELTGEELRS